MKLATILLLNLILVTTCFGQIYLKPMVVGNPNFNSTNNSVICEAFNLPPNGYGTLTHSGNGLTEPVNFIDTLNFFGIFGSDQADYSTVVGYTTNGYTSTYFVESSIVLPKFDYTVTSYTAPSTPTSVDGSITITFDSIIAFNTLGYFHGNSSVDTLILDDNIIQFDSLSDGVLSIGIGNSSDPTDFIAFQVFIGNPNNGVTTGLDMNLNVIHADNNCEGIIITQATNFQGSVYNVWNDGSYNEFSKGSLCPGIYSLYTYNIPPPGGEYLGSIDTLIVTNDYFSYIDSSLFYYTPQDMAYFNSLNCEFDFNLPIDSISYSEDTLFVYGDTIIIGFNFTIYQDSNFFTVYDSLTLGIDSLISMEVILYCDQFKSSFKGRKIAYLRGAPNHDFYQNPDLIVQEYSSLDFVLYPNPAYSEIYGSLPFVANGEFIIFDSAGKKLLQVPVNNSSILSLNIENLSKGVYFLQYNSALGSSNQNFIKYFMKQ